MIIAYYNLKCKRGTTMLKKFENCSCGKEHTADIKVTEAE